MESFNHIFWDFSGAALRDWMNAHNEIPVIATVLYLVLVLCVPKHIMAQRAPMNLSVYNILWNLSLTVFSIGGAYYCVPRMLESLLAPQLSGLAPNANDGPNAAAPVIAGGLYTSACVWNDGVFFDGPVGFWVGAFVISKVLEMIDTVFLVLQKKPVIFLHWYHHLTVLIFCWNAYINAISSGLWFATMNYCVHSVMYFYYFACACGYRKVIRPIAPLITTLQILQMIVGAAIVVYTAYHRHLSGHGCDVDDPDIRFGLFLYVSYLILFSRLFYRSYIYPLVKKKDPTVNIGEKKTK